MVSHTIGFDLERIGVNSIIRAAHEVQAYSNASTIKTLEDQLVHDPVCRQLFIESIVVPESWLFRETKGFPAYKHPALPTPQKTVGGENPFGSLRDWRRSLLDCLIAA